MLREDGSGGRESRSVDATGGAETTGGAGSESSGIGASAFLRTPARLGLACEAALGFVPAFEATLFREDGFFVAGMVRHSARPAGSG